MHKPRNYSTVIIHLPEGFVVRRSGVLLNRLLESPTVRRGWVGYLSREAGRHFLEVADKVVEGEITSAVLLVKALDKKRFDIGGLGTSIVKRWGFKYSTPGIVHITIKELLCALMVIDVGYVRKEFTSRPLRKDMPGFVKPDLVVEEVAPTVTPFPVNQINPQSWSGFFSASEGEAAAGTTLINPESMQASGPPLEVAAVDTAGLERLHATSAMPMTSEEVERARAAIDAFALGGGDLVEPSL